MRLIGAGLPRTATLTQKIALEMLGLAPCYHMVNILSDLSLVPPWIEAFQGRQNWDRIFGNHQATVDWPGAFLPLLVSEFRFPRPRRGERSR